MNQPPFISIICVSYNHSKFIVECLDSIKNQTYKNIELILADDASSDNSVEIFENWLKETNLPVKKNFHTKNIGLVRTLNECLKLATGKYIKYLSCDDFLYPEYLEKCVSKLEELSNDYGMIYTEFNYVNDSSEIINASNTWGKREWYNPDPEIFHEIMISNNQISAISVMLKKEVLDKTNGYDKRFLLEDYPLWMKIAQSYKIAFIPESLVSFRMHSNNTSKVYNERVTHETMIVKMLFDRKGSQKKKVDRHVLKLIIKLLIGRGNYKLYAGSFEAYPKYQYKNRLLAFCCSFLLCFKKDNFIS